MLGFKSNHVSKKTDVELPSPMTSQLNGCPNFLAATKQLYDWFSPSVRPSVCLSVCLSVTPLSPCSHHCIIMKFSGVIIMVKSDVHAKGQCPCSSKVLYYTTNFVNLFNASKPYIEKISYDSEVLSWYHYDKKSLSTLLVHCGGTIDDQ